MLRHPCGLLEEGGAIPAYCLVWPCLASGCEAMLEVSDRLMRNWRIGGHFESTQVEPLRSARNSVV